MLNKRQSEKIIGSDSMLFDERQLQSDLEDTMESPWTMNDPRR